MSLYTDYIAGIEELKGLRRSAWRVQGYRDDKFPGRWECALGSGRFVGPFEDAASAMAYAIDSNKSELHSAIAQEKARAQKSSALVQPEF